MRRGFGLVLFGLGIALLLLAPMVKFYAVPKLAVAPLDLDAQNPSNNAGLAVKLFDPATLTERSNVPLTSIRFTKADVAESQKAGGNNGVYDSFSRVNDSEGKLVTASTERYVFDRTTNVLSTGSGSNVDGTPLSDTEVADNALMPLKMPFFMDQNATYNYFDTTIRKGTPVSFVGEEERDGLTVYKYEGKVAAVQIGEQEGVAALVGSTDPNYKAARFYVNDRVLFVEPLTGQIVDGSEDQLQTLRGPDGTDRITIIAAKISFTPDEVASSVAEAKTNSAKLKMLTTTLPIVCIVLGIIAIAFGLFLVLGARREQDGL